MEEGQIHRRRLLFTHCKSREELRDWVYVFLNLELPGIIVDPDSTTTPLDMVWECYSHFLYGGGDNDVSRRLYYAARDAGKTLCESVIEVFALLHLDINVVHLAAIEEQSRNAQRYLKGFFRLPDLFPFRSGDNVRETAAKLYRPLFEGGLVLSAREYGALEESQQKDYEEHINRAEIVVATMQSVNGKHASLLCVDGDTNLLVRARGNTATKRQRRNCTARGLFRKMCGDNPGGRSGGESDKVLDPAPEGFELLSINMQDGRLEFSKVVRAQRHMRPTVRILTDGTHRAGPRDGVHSDNRTRSPRTPEGDRELICSLDHPVLVQGRGFVQAGELRVGDKVVVLGKSSSDRGATKTCSPMRIPDLQPSDYDEWEQVVIGSLLGDGGIYYKGNSNPWMAEQHSMEQKEYLHWKMKMLSLKVRTKEVFRCSSGYTGKPQVGYYVHASPALLPYKDLKKDLKGAEKLGPLGLAVWYMDDGCDTNGVRFSTENFTEEKCWHLTRILSKNFGIETCVSGYDKDGQTYYYIHGGIEAKRRLVKICAPYIQPELAYKFDVSGNQGVCRFCGEGFWFYEEGRAAVTCADLVCRLLQRGAMLVETVKCIEPAGDRWVYDFTLARNHTYISNGIVSHNCLDELDVLTNPAAYQESVNIPTPKRRKDGTIIMPLTVLTSTRKSAFGLVQDEINRADKTGLVVKHFNLIDVTEKCPTTRHRPDLPKLKVYRNDDTLRAIDEPTFQQLSEKDQANFVEDEAYYGCINNCKMFAVCKKVLADRQTGDSKFLKPIVHTQNQFRNNSIEMAKAQLLCLKPSSVGLIYPRFDKLRHVLSPAQAYEKVFGEPHVNKHLTKTEFIALMRQRDVDWGGGMDFGWTHNFAYIHGFREGRRGFVTHCVAQPELEPDQMVEVCQPFKDLDPAIFADTNDPKMIPVFRKAGFKMRKWKKEKGSVIGGINIVRYKLSPALGSEPELYFVHDTGDDPGMDLMIRHLSEYHWKLDAAGRPSNIPDEENDDEVDALRYWVMNNFTPKGGLQAASESMRTHVEIHPHSGIEPMGSQNNWVREQIAQLTGRPLDEAPPAQRAPMKIEQGGYSYYGDRGSTKGDGVSRDGRKGRKGRLIFDF